MNAIRLLPIAALILAVLVAPASYADDDTTYYWSSYERDLFLLYSNPENLERFEATLERIINTADTSGRKPPPGILAEYGYIHYERGDLESALHYFEREARQWPESEVLMGRMIVHIKERTGS